MTDLHSFFSYLIIMAGVTYLLRALPFVLVKKKIENRFIRSFLEYIPYSVLAAMTFPAVFTSAGRIVPSLCGLLIALILAYKEKGLLQVALAAVAVAGIITAAGINII